jgi:hypothetical protein
MKIDLKNEVLHVDPVGLVEFSAMPRFRASGRAPPELGEDTAGGTYWYGLVQLVT